MWKTKSFSAVIVVVALSSAAYAQTGSPHIDRVLEQMTQALQQSGTANFRQAFLGHVDMGSNISHVLRPDLDDTVVVAGFCDTDCDDMDIEILSPRGQVIAEDLLTDPYPEVRFKPRAGQEYHVRASMPGCSTNPCYYGVLVINE